MLEMDCWQTSLTVLQMSIKSNFVVLQMNASLIGSVENIWKAGSKIYRISMISDIRY